MDVRATLLGSLFVFLLCIGTEGAAAQDDAVGLDVDHAVFAYSDTTSLVELYFSFDAGSLPFESVDTGYRAVIPLAVRVMPSEGESTPVWTDSLALQFTVSDTADVEAGQMFLHQHRVEIPPGRYLVTIDQPEPTRPDRSIRSIDRELAVGDFAASGEPMFSEITLASRIQRSDERENPFYKHGLLIRPNPRTMYGRGLSRLYYYVELYRPGRVPEVSDRYRIRSYVTPVHQKMPVDSLERTVERAVRSPDVLVGQFDISGLPSGSYELHAEVHGSGDQAAVSQRRRFFVYNPDVAPETANRGAAPAVSARYRSMDEEMVDIAAAAAAEIGSPSERREIQRLNDAEEKRAFLTRFWARRDETPATVVNERENQFYQSLRTVREQYDSPFGDAWETDRGRTMLRYGPPSQIDSHLHERETRPYVVWRYDHIPEEGNAQFVFIDREGFGEFDLVHSTARGEVKNPEWQRLIR